MCQLSCPSIQFVHLHSERDGHHHPVAATEMLKHGCRFDGFNAALENASADIASAEHSLRQAASHSSALLSPHSGARAQLRSGVKGLQRLVADTWTAGRRAVASGVLSPERDASPSPPQRSTPSPPAQADSGDEAGVLSNDASPGGSARYIPEPC